MSSKRYEAQTIGLVNYLDNLGMQGRLPAGEVYYEKLVFDEEVWGFFASSKVIDWFMQQ